MSAQLRPIGIIAFASALLAFGVPTNIAFAGRLPYGSKFSSAAEQPLVLSYRSDARA
jgi:hypothetical protein